MKRLKTSCGAMALRLGLSLALTAVLIFSYRVITPITDESFRVAALWIHGSAVALVLGHLWTSTILRLIRNYIYSQTLKRREKIDSIYIDPLAVPGWAVGTIERVFFGALIAFDISATAAGMVTWILVKMATDWNRILGNQSKDDHMYGPRSLALI